MDKPFTLFVQDDGETMNQSQLKSLLENGDDDDKIRALKKTIKMMIQGEKLPQLLMTIIRFVMSSKNHTIKKLLLLYWEIVDKTKPNGELLNEMVLVCNGFRKDLEHPNEYVRGSTLRFLCKLKEPELLEPMINEVLKNLDDRFAYVRRNAVLALYSIYKENERLCPNAPDAIYDFLCNEKEEDDSCKRNALIMLYNCAQDKALEYLNTVLDEISTFGDIQQFVFIDLIKKVCRQENFSRSRYIRSIISLLTAKSPAVQYEAACALLILSNTPTAIKASTSTLINLLCNESDNNVKLILLDKLMEIKKKHSKIIQELLMDVLRALSSPTLDIKKKTLDFAMDLVNPRNIDDVILLLKKEISKTQSGEFDKVKAGAYRQILIQAIHFCALKFPDVANNVVHALMDYLGDSKVATAVDVIDFVGEVIQTYPERQRSIVRKLLDNLYQIKSRAVFRSSLWIISEYSESVEDIDASFTAIKEILGDCPFLKIEEEKNEKEENNNNNNSNSNNNNDETTKTTTPKILSDGTYASQSAFSNDVVAKVEKNNVPNLRSMILNGDFFLASVVGTSFTKLALKLRDTDIDDIIKNSMTAEVLLYLTSFIQLGKKGTFRIDSDSYENMILCIRILTSPNNLASEILKTESRKIFAKNLEEKNKLKSSENQKKQIQVQADQVINCRLLKINKNLGEFESGDDDLDLIRATGLSERNDKGGSLQRVHQLTGFSDALYAEAYVHVHRYDIVLEVLVINRTTDTLQNVSLELATRGDLKLCERPQTYNIGSKKKIWIKSNIKVSSTETGIIFGYLVYDISGSSASEQCVVLNDINIDIMDYINPATCSEVMFRVMWAEFEWENKVLINSNISNVQEFLEHVIKFTNMKCLTPSSALEGNCGFLSANLYARSIFGEDALANVSLEESNGKVGGYIRIRSKTQGIALSLGDKITLKQSNKD